MPFQLSKIQPSKNSITPPESVSLSFTLTSSNGVAYSVSYSLADTNNFFFQKVDGIKTKTITQNGTMVGSLAVFNENFKIVMEGAKAYSYFTLKVIAKSQITGDVKSCKISIS